MGFIEDTQQKLGAVITKPELTEARLTKPPVRFILDIVKSVVQTTGYLGSVYDESELSPDSIADKDGKLKFLNKLIGAVDQTLGTSLKDSVKAAKIAAGQEPENTNLLLQKLAEACSYKEKKSSSRKEAPASKESKKAPSDKAAAESTPKKSSSIRDSSSDLKKTQEIFPSKGSPQPKRKSESSKEEKKDDKKQEDPKKKKAAEEEAKRQKQLEEAALLAAKEKEKENEKAERERARAQEKAEKAERERAAEAEKQKEAEKAKAAQEAMRKKKPELETRDEPSPEPDVTHARPQTARRPPPKVQANVRTVGKTGASDKNEVAAVPAPQVIEEGNDKDDDDSIVIVHRKEEAGVSVADIEHEKHGALVTNIINTNKGFEKDGAAGKRVRDTKEINREKLQKEIKQLQEAIQTLSQNANPLGKCMDLVQEDFEGMSKELEYWKTENTKQTQSVEEEERQTESALQQYYAKLSELDVQIKETLGKINTTKSKLMENDKSIQQMLYMVVKA